MNKQTISAAPDEDKVEELLEKIQPVPGKDFHEKIEKATWRVDRDQRLATKKLRLKFTFAVITLLLLSAFFVTPQGRAWAQEVAQFFRRINSMMIQLPAEQQKQLKDESMPSYDLPLVPVFIPTASPEAVKIPGCETPQRSQSYRCQVALAESKLGFDLKELPEKLNDWAFQSFSFDPDSRYAAMSYKLDITGAMSYSYLTLIQGAGDFSNYAWYRNNPWEAVPTDKVEPVLVGAYQGEYVMGGFSLWTGDTALTWHEETGRQRLIWSESDRWYLIDFSPNLNVAGTMGKDQLIRLAESLVASPISPTKSSDPTHLTSISDAEKISGLDLKAPTLLPMNIDFSYARALPSGKQVQLIYGENEELIIREQAGESKHYTFPVVKINGEDAYFYTSEGSDTHLFLWWYRDGLNYQMDFNQSLGWHIDKEKMILIAESLQDIDDFRKESGGYFEQVALYKQALRLDAKEFSEAPAGWVFDNVWGDPNAQCLTLMYTAATGQGTLFIVQCKTDEHFDVSAFPAKSIEQVNLKNTKGQYIAGDFVMGIDGKETWDPTSPRKQLYWQEDGLSIQMGVYGEGPVLPSKEDLISYAESLR